MQRAILVLALATIPVASCAPTIAGGLVVAGGGSLYGAKKFHGDCGGATGSAATRACMWNDLMFTYPLVLLGVALIATGASVGVYSAVHEDD